MRSYLLVLWICCARAAVGQGQVDVRALGSFNVEKRIDRALSVTGFVAGIATYDLHEIGFAFADAGVKYRIRKGLAVNANYRCMLRRNLENSYDLRQTLYFDVDGAHAMGRWTATGTLRTQRHYYGRLFEGRKTPLTYSRFRAGLRYRANYFVQPMVEGELFLPIDHPTRRSVDQFRVMAGVGITFNDRLKVELLEQWQQQVNRPARDTYFLTAMNWYYRL